MQYIITQVDVNDFKTSVLDICNTRSQAIYKLHNCYCCDIDTTKVYIKKDGDDEFVEEYRLNKGYVYNSKTLKYVYRILEYTSPNEFKKELDQAIQKRTQNKKSK